MKKVLFTALVLEISVAFCLLACSCKDSSRIPQPAEDPQAQEGSREEEKPQSEDPSSEVIAKFQNPVLRYDWPDPTIWYDGNRFYTVATGIGSMFASKDMVSWYKVNGTPLTMAAREKAKENGSNFWAPDVVKVGEKWMLYLTCYNSATDCGIAAFSSESVSGPFEWVGMITHSKDTGIQDTIDPEVVFDEGTSRLWLFFGSIGSIHRVLLSPDGCSLAPDAQYTKVAGLTYAQDKTRAKVFEGSYLHRHDGYWYLFVSSGNYGNSSYRVKVGRSPSLEGQFVDKEGNKMLDGYASEILTSLEGDNYYGPGHNGEIFTDQRGQDYMFYHCHDASTGSKARYTFLQRIFWDRDGWPYFEGGKPLGEDYKPKF